MSDPCAAWTEEKRSAWLYRIIAACERGTPRETLFVELARAADEQAGIWEDVLAPQGRTPPRRFRPDLRTRLVARLVRSLGPRPMRDVLAAMKVRGMALYKRDGVMEIAVSYDPDAVAAVLARLAPSERDDLARGVRALARAASTS